jgi:hypothetical protein
MMLLYRRANPPLMRISYIPTVTCPTCKTKVTFAPSPFPPEHLHLKKVSFVSPCPNTKCKRLVTADPPDIRWEQVDMDEGPKENLPF